MSDWVPYQDSFALNIGAVGEIGVFALNIGAEADSGPLGPFSIQLVLPGTSYDKKTSALVIPIAALSGLSSEEADAVSGNWLNVFQALLLALDSYLMGLVPIERPLTVTMFTLEDWNRKDTRFGRHMKRMFIFDFIVNEPYPQIFNIEE